MRVRRAGGDGCAPATPEAKALVARDPRRFGRQAQLLRMVERSTRVPRGSSRALRVRAHALLNLHIDPARRRRCAIAARERRERTDMDRMNATRRRRVLRALAATVVLAGIQASPAAAK